MVDAEIKTGSTQDSDLGHTIPIQFQPASVRAIAIFLGHDVRMKQIDPFGSVEVKKSSIFPGAIAFMRTAPIPGQALIIHALLVVGETRHGSMDGGFGHMKF